MDRLTSRKNYVGYLANRPGAVKFGKHGLFSQSDETIELEKTTKEIAAHGGNVWTHVVSLHRDSAQAMGYDNLKAWRDLVKRQVSNIAENQKIEMKNLRGLSENPLARFLNKRLYARGDWFSYHETQHTIIAVV